MWTGFEALQQHWLVPTETRGERAGALRNVKEGMEELTVTITFKRWLPLFCLPLQSANLTFSLVFIAIRKSSNTSSVGTKGSIGMKKSIPEKL